MKTVWKSIKGTENEHVNYYLDVLEAKIYLGRRLYASKPVMEIYKDYGWDYLVRFKDGSIPSIAEEYPAILKKGKRIGRSL